MMRVTIRGVRSGGVAGVLALCGLALSASAQEVTILGPNPSVANVLRLERIKPELQVGLVGGAVALQPGDAALLAEAVGGGYARVWEHGASKDVTRYMIARPLSAAGVKQGAIAGAMKASALARLAPLVVETFAEVGEVRLRLPEGVDPSAMTHFLMKTGEYEYVEPDWQVYPAVTTPNDSQFASSWQHTRLQSTLAWDLETGSSDVVVGVVDSGIDIDHPDLTASRVPGFNAVTNVAEVNGGDVSDVNAAFGHGTFVAGCAAARGNNATGVVGVGWNFGVMPVRVSGVADGSAAASDITQGARWAADNGARIVNVSFSGVEAASTQTTGAYIKARNSLLFYAAGNDNAMLPANEWPDVVVVAATSSNDTRWSSSNFGGMVSVSAPGNGVRSTRLNNTYGNSSGTSFASPIAAGVGALIMSARPELPAGDVQEILYASVDDLGTPGEDNNFGRGRVNSFKAVQAALAITDVFVPFTQSFTSGPVDPAVWETVTNVSVMTAPEASLNGGSTAMLSGVSAMTTRPIRAASLAGSGATLSFELLERGVDVGEAIRIEYFDQNDTWQPLATVPSDGPTGRAGFVRYEARVPTAALRTGLRFRVSTATADGDAAWYLDGFSLTAPPNMAPPVFDPFVTAALDRNATFEASASSSISDLADNEPSGNSALRIAGTTAIQTRTFADSPGFNANPVIRFDYQTRGVPAGHRLRVEVFDFDGFSTITDLVSTGVDAPGFTAFEAVIPGWAPSFFDGNRVRLTMLDGGVGAWFIDEFHLGEGYIAPGGAGPSGCNAADLSEAFGTLDINDVLVFAGAFNAGDPSADLFADGMFDINDVLNFATAFNAGCP